MKRNSNQNLVSCAVDLSPGFLLDPHLFRCVYPEPRLLWMRPLVYQYALTQWERDFVNATSLRALEAEWRGSTYIGEIPRQETLVPQPGSFDSAYHGFKRISGWSSRVLRTSTGDRRRLGP